ncbi:hypothetical protein T02_13174 [Trichinella nativa]|nr:hypothetical protein T09_1362 [Trichinella sp. T9]KRY61021.1 hypothetical protein T03_4984 [Trichinella britovi]KRZ50005.1 hypothetical protein T02_13174 [Trichinella nativa]KRZ92844.1 hypothetical protein T08_9640 [Trichinella sp. T8]
MNKFSESKKIFITIMTLFIDEGCHNSISCNRIEKSGAAIQFLLFNVKICSLDEEQTEDDEAT